MKAILLTASLLLPLSAVAQMPATQHLYNGEHLVLQGRLKPVPRGRLQFMTIRTRDAFTNPGVVDQPFHEIALAGSLDYELLYRHRGETVTVSGTVAVDDASPYYLLGAVLHVNSILTAAGRDLSGYASATPMPPATRSYKAVAVLPADLAAPWTYRVEGRAEDTKGWLSCGSNGGGDVVNCFCADGFQPVHASSTTHGVTSQIFRDMHLAQFATGDGPVATELHVTCSR